MADDDSIERIVEQHYQCPRCGFYECNPRRVKVDVADHMRMYAGHAEHFLAVSCKRCGFTDLFDLSVLVASPHAGAFLYKD